MLPKKQLRAEIKPIIAYLLAFSGSMLPRTLKRLVIDNGIFAFGRSGKRCTHTASPHRRFRRRKRNSPVNPSPRKQKRPRRLPGHHLRPRSFSLFPALLCRTTPISKRTPSKTSKKTSATRTSLRKRICTTMMTTNTFPHNLYERVAPPLTDHGARYEILCPAV